MREGVIGVAFSPDGSRLMTGDTDVSATQVWDVSINGDAEVANLAGVSYHYGSATYTPDGRHVIASSVGNSVTVWDPHTVRTVRTLGDGPPPEVKGVLAPTVPTGLEVGAVAVSPDGRAVAAVTYADGAFFRSGGDDIVRTWDLTAGEATLSLQPGGEIVGSAWDPDGELLALTLAEPGRADRVAVFDPTGEEVAQLRAEPPTAFGEIAFSLDGRRLLVPRLASEASDTETRGVDVWDWRRGEVVDTIKTPHGYSAEATTVGADGVVRIWTLRLDDLVAIAEGRAA
jgi:WD40 repeat protein